jgi:hypothetical protein
MLFHFASILPKQIPKNAMKKPFLLLYHSALSVQLSLVFDIKSQPLHFKPLEYFIKKNHKQKTIKNQNY